MSQENLVIHLLAMKGDKTGEFTYPICIKPEVTYEADYYSGSGHWGSDSFVRILINNTIIYQGSIYLCIQNDSFIYHECNTPDTLATISIQYADNAESQSFSLTSNDSTGTVDILKKDGKRDWKNRLFSYSFCYGPDRQYTIKMETSSGIAWNENSYIKVTRGDEVIIKSSMSHTAIGTDTFYYRAPCTSSEIEATVSRYYGSNGCTDESFDIYKGSEKSGVAIFHGKGNKYSNYVTSVHSICIEPEQKYSIAYHAKDKNGWYRDSNKGFSHVKILKSNTLIFSGHLESGDYGVESFVYHTDCSESEIQATVRREYGEYPMHEPFRIFKGEVAEGNHVMSLYGNSEDKNMKRTFSICIEKEQKYSTLYYTSYDNGWTDNGVYESSVSIIYGSKLLESGSLTGNKKIGYGSFSYSNSCKSNEISVTLVRQYSDLAHREYFELFKGNEESNLFVFGIYGMTDDNGKALNYTVCVEHNQLYTVKYGSDDKKKWNSNSYIDVQYSGFTIFHGEYHGSTLTETFTARLPSCAGDNDWKETTVGEKAIASCKSSDYEGQRERMCIAKSNTATWGPITDKCTLKAPIISYSQSFYNFTKTEMTKIVPITKIELLLLQ